MRLTPAIVEMFHKHFGETVVKSNLLCINIILCGSVMTNIGKFRNI